jgi:hypothetical protein
VALQLYLNKYISQLPIKSELSLEWNRSDKKLTVSYTAFSTHVLENVGTPCNLHTPAVKPILFTDPHKLHT